MLKVLAREQELTNDQINISALSRETGFDCKTVRHYFARASPPEMPLQRTKPSKPDPYKLYIRERLAKFPRLSRVRLLEEIQNKAMMAKRPSSVTTSARSDR